jgi:hypothetical protein
MKEKWFVGVLEHDSSQKRDFCILNLRLGFRGIASSIATLAEVFSQLTGSDFKDAINYDPPKGIDGTNPRLYPGRYYPLSVKERKAFEKNFREKLAAK